MILNQEKSFYFLFEKIPSKKITDFFKSSIYQNRKNICAANFKMYFESKKVKSNEIRGT